MLSSIGPHAHSVTSQMSTSKEKILLAQLQDDHERHMNALNQSVMGQCVHAATLWNECKVTKM